MKIVAYFLAARSANIATAMERQRLSNTMPGQIGAMTAARLGFLVR